MPILSPRARRAVALVGLVLVAGSCTARKPVARSSPAATVPASPSAASPSAASPSAAPTTSATGTASPGSAAGSPPAPSLSWRSCGSPFQCATLSVPLDWSNPGTGGTVKLAVIRLPASGAQSQRIGSLVVNPGGPGASAVDFLRSSIRDVMPSEILRRFDLVAFDPRGIGGSQPLSCLSGPAMDAFLATDPAPTTPEGVNAVVDASKTFAAGCAKQYGTTFLAHIDTQDTARDMDALRQGLGDAKLTYIGYSYGTFLGAQYAGLFPGHVRALALDGAVDPAVQPLDFDAAQAVGFDTELGDFFSNCANSCAFAHGSPARQAFTTLEANLSAHPLKVGNRLLNKAMFIDGVADALYSPSLWPSLSSALDKAAQGDGGPLLTMSDDLTERNGNGNYSSLSSAGAAVNCVDSAYPTDPAAYQAAAQAAAQQAPVFGPAIVWSSIVCAVWPVPPVVHPGPIRAAGAPPILVIGTTGDPATPYQMAVNLASELQSGVLLRHVGVGHTSLAEPSGCVTQAEDNYLINLVPPTNGASCGNSSAPPSPPSTGTIGYRPSA